MKELVAVSCNISEDEPSVLVLVVRDVDWPFCLVAYVAVQVVIFFDFGVWASGRQVDLF